MGFAIRSEMAFPIAFLGTVLTTAIVGILLAKTRKSTRILGIQFLICTVTAIVSSFIIAWISHFLINDVRVSSFSAFFGAPVITLIVLTLLDKKLKSTICIGTQVLSFIFIILIGIQLHAAGIDGPRFDEGYLTSWGIWSRISAIGASFITFIVLMLLNKKLKIALYSGTAYLSFIVIALIGLYIYSREIPVPFIYKIDREWEYEYNWLYAAGIGALLITLIVWCLLELLNHFKQKTSNTITGEQEKSETSVISGQ